MERKIYQELLEWKNTNIDKPLMVIGARQIGKTYIINEFCKREFEEYIYINLLEQADIVKIFKQEINTQEKFNRMKIYLDKDIDLEKTIIFFDEIQECEEIISALKYFNESSEPFKIICAGSLLGVKIKRMHSSFPVGKVKMINMYPMDFEEFLMANNSKPLIEEIKKSYKTNEPLDLILHKKTLDLYRLYLCVGGMPASINNILSVDKDIMNYNKKIIKNIINGYLSDMKKYVKDATETVRIENIYNSIPTQIGNKSNKFQYSKVRSGARSKNYETALQWLLASKLVNRTCLLRTPQNPPEAFKDEEIFKLYLSDVGILNSVLDIKFEDIILDKEFIYKGDIVENYVQQQLNVNFEHIYYWKNDNTAEVDFIIQNEDGLIPIEVKAGDSVKSKSLNLYMKQFKPKYGIKLCTKNFGYVNGLKTVPLYATFLIK